MQIESGLYQSLGEIDAPRYEADPSTIRSFVQLRLILIVRFVGFVLDREARITRKWSYTNSDNWKINYATTGMCIVPPPISWTRKWEKSQRILHIVDER